MLLFPYFHFYEGVGPLCGGEGAGGFFLWSAEDLLNKNVSYTSIITKSTLKIPFLLKTTDTKTFSYFARHFLFKKIICLRHPDLFSFKIN
jgi:hypothetical protein